MKNNEVVTSQGGLVTFYGNEIDVKPGVKTVKIIKNLMMYDTNKCFPDVVELNIVKNVNTIEIPNSLFPNVKNVISKSPYFVSNVPYLIHSNGTFFRHDILLNTFFHKADEVIHLAEPKKFCIAEIADYAFAECESMHLEGEGSVMKCGKLGFAKSAFEKQPFINGVKTAGSIIIEIDNSASVIDLPDKEHVMTTTTTEFTGNEHVITHNIDTFLMHNVESLPKWITIDIKEKPVKQNSFMYGIEPIIHRIRDNGNHISIFDITPETAKANNVICENGIVYSEDRKILIFSQIQQKDVVIPDGVEKICSRAFKGCLLESVVIPDSVKIIGNEAFYACENLKNVVLGKGLETIRECTFMWCKNLTKITIPGQVKRIENDAFFGSGLVSISLNEGIEEMGDTSICGADVQELTLPSTITYFDGLMLSRDVIGVLRLTLKKYIINIAKAITSPGEPWNGSCDNWVEVICEGKKVYIPKYSDPTFADKMNDSINMFFQKNEMRYITCFEYAYTKECKENMAILEYAEFGDEKAKEYLKKQASKLVERLISGEDEELAVKFFKLHIASKYTLKKALRLADEYKKTTLKSYILEELEESNTVKQNFYI